MVATEGKVHFCSDELNSWMNFMLVFAVIFVLNRLFGVFHRRVESSFQPSRLEKSPWIHFSNSSADLTLKYAKLGSI
jgi:hypothetical protein